MYISYFQIWDDKSFWEKEAVALSRGINIVTGQNNFGKTALLEVRQQPWSSLQPKLFDDLHYAQISVKIFGARTYTRCIASQSGLFDRDADFTNRSKTVGSAGACHLVAKHLGRRIVAAI